MNCAVSERSLRFEHSASWPARPLIVPRPRRAIVQDQCGHAPVSGRRTRCPTGRPAPTALSRRGTPIWAFRGGFRRCRAPGSARARPAARRRGRRTHGARSATTHRVRRRPRSRSGPHRRSPRRSGNAAGRCARPRRDLLYGFGEGAAPAVVLPASPPGLAPPQYDAVLTIKDVARRGAHPFFRRHANTPHDGHAAAAGTVVAMCTTRVRSEKRSTRSTRTPGSPNNNVVPSNTALGSLPPPECFATFRLQKAKGPPIQRHAHESEIITARLRLKSHKTSA
jgi:hypothetical protein